MKGEAVYADHPFFVRDELFASCLIAAALARNLEMMNHADKSLTDEMLSWLQGETPILDDVLEALLRSREKHSELEGIEIAPADRKL